MKVAIIQSNYIPWRGYFDIIDDVDFFIFFDSVQYTRHDWRNRNIIKTVNGTSWITVPVLFSLKDPTSIMDTRIDYKKKWIKKHTETIKQAYSKTAFLSDYFDEFVEILNIKHETISQLNISLIKWIMKKLSISTKTKLSSEFDLVDFKTDKIIHLLKQVGAETYISGPAGKNYLDSEKFKEADIQLEYKTYGYNEYNQLHGKFEPSVTILDLLFNCGSNSFKYLKSISSNERVL